VVDVVSRLSAANPKWSADDPTSAGRVVMVVKCGAALDRLARLHADALRFSNSQPRRRVLIKKQR